MQAPEFPISSPTQPDLLIHAHNLSKSYPLFARPHHRLAHALFPHKKHPQDFHALQNISLAIPRGETLAIVGKNGSGKSTLLQLLAQTIAPTAGSLQIKGRAAAILELGAGFHPDFTGRENVALNARILGLTPNQIAARFNDIAAFADIGPFLDQPVKTYSSGMLVRLAFAVIANVDADLLIIDEALAVGDIFFVQKCMRFLRDFQQKKGTIVFVSHDAAAILALAHRALWLDHGQIQSIGSPKTVLQNYLAAAHGFQTPPSPNASPSPDYGQRKATITSATLTTANPPHTPLTLITGHESAALAITATAHQKISPIILGFFVKDRLGQNLFGDNTFSTHPATISANPNDTITAAFHFTMPALPAGDYTITIALAEGTQQSHTLQHWQHEALTFRSITQNDALGLVGIPMTNIEFHTSSSPPKKPAVSDTEAAGQSMPNAAEKGDATISDFGFRISDLLPHALTPPRLLSDFSAWIPHIPFAFTLIHLLRPRTFVELGTHKGDSYCAFCQAVQSQNLPTKCTAVDTWRGDPSAGLYDLSVLQKLKDHHDPLYSHFSTLLQSTFDHAAQSFQPNSIDLLHIDGSHDYPSVLHDFQTWRPLLSHRAVVLFHDTQVTTEPFGVHQLWQQLRPLHPHFEFTHAYGLGILALGTDIPTDFQNFLTYANQNPTLIQSLFSTLGNRLDLTRALSLLTQQLQSQHQSANEYRPRINAPPLDPLHLHPTDDPKAWLDHLVRQATLISGDFAHSLSTQSPVEKP